MLCLGSSKTSAAPRPFVKRCAVGDLPPPPICSAWPEARISTTTAAEPGSPVCNLSPDFRDRKRNEAERTSKESTEATLSGLALLESRQRHKILAASTPIRVRKWFECAFTLPDSRNLWAGQNHRH